MPRVAMSCAYGRATLDDMPTLSLGALDVLPPPLVGGFVVGLAGAGGFGSTLKADRKATAARSSARGTPAAQRAEPATSIVTAAPYAKVGDGSKMRTVSPSAQRNLPPFLVSRPETLSAACVVRRSIFSLNRTLIVWSRSPPCPPFAGPPRTTRGRPPTLPHTSAP